MPCYDRAAVVKISKTSPQWIHLGAGNIFRALIAQAVQDSLACGKMDRGILVAEGFDAEIIPKAYRPYDNLCVSVSLEPNGNVVKTVIGSIVESLNMQSEDADWQRLIEIFESPTLQMVSFTITEKGYNLQNASGTWIPAVKEDFENGPDAPKSYMGKVAALCYRRFCAGAFPIALVSMDNCSQNGERLRRAIHQYAEVWEENEQVKKGFLDYVKGEQVAYPWTAIDKITPRPDPVVEQMLTEDGLEDMGPTETAGHTFVAPYVNAESAQYLVIEDDFPNGRPDFSARGIYFTSRETVEKFEKMKVCSCLNPVHTALAVFGCLLGFQRISEEMKDPDLRHLAEGLVYRESLCVTEDPEIIRPEAFAWEVLEERLPNPFLPDTPQRIACDTSQKISIRFGETIKSYIVKGIPTNSMRFLPLVLAGWCRYLTGIGDDGQPFALSPDPMLPVLHEPMSGIAFGSRRPSVLGEILHRSDIFGVDLYEAGLGEKVEYYFERMMDHKGAVREMLNAIKGEDELT